MIIFLLPLLVAAVLGKPSPGLLGGHYGGYGDYGAEVVSQPLYSQPLVKSYAVAQPLLHAAPAAVVAKPGATSYASFQQFFGHPVSVSQPIVQHAALVAQPVIHAAPVVAQPVLQKYISQPIVQTVSHPVVQTYAQPVLSKYVSQPIVAQPQVVSYGSYGHGW